jgi:hypothetical protein
LLNGRFQFTQGIADLRGVAGLTFGAVVQALLSSARARLLPATCSALWRMVPTRSTR